MIRLRSSSTRSAATLGLASLVVAIAASGLTPTPTAPAETATALSAAETLSAPPESDPEPADSGGVGRDDAGPGHGTGSASGAAAAVPAPPFPVDDIDPAPSLGGVATGPDARPDIPDPRPDIPDPRPDITDSDRAVPVVDTQPSPAASATVTPRASDLPAAVADVTDDEVVDALDVTAARGDWEVARRQDGACSLSAETADSDVNRDGCIDSTDLDLIAGRSGTAVSSPGATRAAVTTDESRSVDIVVDTTSDDADTDYHDGACRTPAGTCSLRAAITQANAHAGPDRIRFAIPGSGTKTIALGAALPALTDLLGGVTIDGYTQPGARANTSTTAFDAVVRIQIAGPGAPGSILTVYSGDNIIRGLAFYRAERHLTLVGRDAARNTIAGNIIGSNSAQSFRREDGTGYQGFYAGGVWLYGGAKSNQIGTPAVGDRNIIGGPVGYGVMIEHGGTSGNVVRNNIIGLRGDGAPMTMFRGVDIQWGADDNIVGGLEAADHNVISGNYEVGLDMSHTSRGTSVIGNLIGTGLDGNSGTPAQSNKVGIEFKDGAYDNLLLQNVVANNTQHGIYSLANYTRGSRLIDNRLGIGSRGAALPNGLTDLVLNGTGFEVRDNTFAHGTGIQVRDDYSEGDNTNYPKGLTEQNRILDNVYFASATPVVDILPVGANANDAGDADSGIHGLRNHPEVTAFSNSVASGTACAGCTVEASLVGADDNPNTVVASTVASGSGTWRFDAPVFRGVDRLQFATIDVAGNTSEFSPTAINGLFPAVSPTSYAGTFAPYTIGGRSVIATPNKSVSNTAGFPGTTSTLTFRVDVPRAGAYTFDVGTFAPSSGGNSFYFRVNGDGGTTGRTWADLPVSSSVTARVLTDTVTNQTTWTLPAGTTTVEFAMFEDGAGFADLRLAPAAAATPSTLDAIADRSNSLGSTISTTPGRTNTSGRSMVFDADGLPLGLAIDPVTGTVSGTATDPGRYRTTIYGFDGATVAQRSFTWSITGGNHRPRFDSPGSWIIGTGRPVDHVVAASDPDGDPLRYTSSGLPAGLSMTTAGRITGAPSTVGSTIATVTATDPSGASSTTRMGWNVIPAPLTCVVDGPARVLRWTNAPAGTTYVGSLNPDGTSKAYVGSSTTDSIAITDVASGYEIHNYADGHRSATCAGDASAAFTCTVDAAARVLRWTNAPAGTAYVGSLHPDGTSNTYIGASTTGSIAITDTTVGYEVHVYSDGHAETRCAGVPGGA